MSIVKYYITDKGAENQSAMYQMIKLYGSYISAKRCTLKVHHYFKSGVGMIDRMTILTIVILKLLHRFGPKIKNYFMFC